MSIFFQQIAAANNGTIPLSLGTGALVDPVYSQGLALDGGNSIFATTATPPTQYFSGLPFDDDGRLVVEDAAIVHYDQGLPFTASGAIAATTDGTGGFYNQGVLFGASGAFVVNGLAPPVTPSNVLAVAFTSLSLGPAQFWGMNTDPWNRLASPIPSSDIGTYGVVIDFTEVGNLLAIGGNGNHDVEVYDVSTVPFTPVFDQSYGSASVRDVTFSPDGTYLYVGITSSNSNVIYRTSDWAGTGLTGAQGTCACFSLDNNILINGYTGSPFLEAWDTSAYPPTLIGGIPSATQRAMEAITRHPTENVAFLGHSSGEVDILNIDTLTVVDQFDMNHQIRDAQWSPTGDKIAIQYNSPGTDPKLIVYNTPDPYDASTWTTVSVTGVPTTAVSLGCAWNFDGSILAAGALSETPALKAWDTTSEPYTPISNFDDVNNNGVQRMVFISGVPLP